MASKKNLQNPAIEVAGIVLIGFAIFLSCCLLTYYPDDPSFSTGYSQLPEKISNLGGLVGSYVSSWLFQMLGLAAYLIPVVLFLFSIKILYEPDFPYMFYVRLLLYILFIVCIQTLMSLYIGRLDFYRYNFDAGGIIGILLSGSLTGYLNVFGAYLLLVIMVLLIIMVITRVSYVHLWNGLSGKVLSKIKLPSGSAGAYFKGKVKNWSDLLKSRSKKTAVIKQEVDKTSSGDCEPEEEESKEVIVKPEPEDKAYRQAEIKDDIPINVYVEKSEKEEKKEPVFEPVKKGPAVDYKLPTLSLLDESPDTGIEFNRDVLREDADILIQKLNDFGVKGRVVNISPGPVITRYELEPAPGVKLNKIVGLSDDLALALKAMSVRIAPIPGKSVIGIELPNKKRKNVSFREIVSREEFIRSKSKLILGLGKDIAGGTVINDLSRMPHLLVAGTTGSGKSVFVNTVICSILYNSTPDEVRFLMIDPKRLELFPYDGIPHLLHPVVVDPKKAAVALSWAVQEMERRYKTIAANGTRNIVQYNKKIEKEIESGKISADDVQKMPYIVVIIDELADLMMIASRDVESYIARLAQMARASGIHLLIATQRPSVDVLTGVIKANFPSRISFQVSSKVDSRTIIDTMGAEKLLGMGDMLFIPPGTSMIQRIHGAYISEKEIFRITEFIKSQGQPTVYDESIVAINEEESSAPVEGDDDYDELYDQAVALVAEIRQASISMLQRKMRVGYNRAARMIERMEKEGVVGVSDGVRPREVLINKL
jgi:S-DNA-T family DNA segregation ATPase FtsK/SpoIIIE